VVRFLFLDIQSRGQWPLQEGCENLRKGGGGGLKSYLGLGASTGKKPMRNPAMAGLNSGTTFARRADLYALTEGRGGWGNIEGFVMIGSDIHLPATRQADIGMEADTEPKRKNWGTAHASPFERRAIIDLPADVFSGESVMLRGREGPT